MGLIITFLVLFILALVIDAGFFTYLHELAHKRKLKKYKIKGEIIWNFRELIKNAFLIKPVATTIFDEKKFTKLSYSKKKEIALAGIKTDIIAVFYILIFLFVFVISNIIYKEPYFLYASFLCLALSLSRILHIKYNLFSKDSDLGKLLEWKK